MYPISRSDIGQHLVRSGVRRRAFAFECSTPLSQWQLTSVNLSGFAQRNIGLRRRASMLITKRIRNPLLGGEKPLHSRTDDLGTWLIDNLFSQERGFAAMSRQPEERALRYHNYAAFLRRLANRTQAETARARLRTLADQFDQLAESIHRARLAA